jgi:hypothetical protein
MRDILPRPAALAGLLTAALLLAACASAGGRTGPFAEIVVINDSPSMVNIYAIPGGQRIRIGQVTGVGEQTFGLFRRHLDGSGRLRLLIDPIGSPRQYPTDAIVVLEGDVIEFRVSSFVR